MFLKRWIFVLILTFVTNSVFCSTKKMFNIVSENENEIILEFEISDYNLETIIVDGSITKQLKFDKWNLNSEIAGAPNIPSFAPYIRLNNNKKIEKVEIVSKNIKTFPIDTYTPSKIMEIDGRAENLRTINHKFYKSNFPETQLKIGTQGIMRSNRISQIIFKPVSFNPKTKTASLIYKGQIKCKLISTDENPICNVESNFTNIINSIVVNPLETRDQTQSLGSYIFIYNGSQAVLDKVNELVSWKRDLGHKVYITSTNDIGNSSSAIKSWIADTYNNDPSIEYLCIVGDSHGSNSVATYEQNYSGSNVAGDHNYTLLDGNDIFPEISVGRLSYDSISVLNVILKKIIRYESQPLLNDGQWLNKALLVGDPGDSGVSTITTTDYIAELINDYDSEIDLDYFTESPFVSHISSSLNSGVGAYFYRGFGSVSGWTDNDCYNLVNDNMTPFISFITCYTGNYQSSYNVSEIETFLRAGSSTTGIGGVAAIGSSSETHTCFNNIITASLAYSLYHDNNHSFGEALMRGKLALYENYPENPNEYVDWYTLGKNLMGDPGTNLWLTSAQDFTAEIPASINNNDDLLEIFIDSPQATGFNVNVTDFDHSTSAFGITGSDGKVYIPIPETQSDSLLVTISKEQFVPQQFTIQKSNQDLYEFNTLSTSNVETGGNGNLSISLINNSGNILENENVTIKSLNENFVLTDSILTFSQVPIHSETSSNEINYSISSFIHDTEKVVFEISGIINGENIREFKELELIAPEITLDIEEFSVEESTNILSIATSLTNTGSLSLNPSEILVSTNNSYLTPIYNIRNIPEIPQQQTYVNTDSLFQFSISEEILEGENISFTINISTTNYNKTIQFDSIIPGATITDPTGPDNYGYLIYDDEDSSYTNHPNYEWIEIDPEFGGLGERLNAQDHDTEGSGDVKVIDLPFQVSFYGINYQEISISSNGYIMMGNQYTQEWMNWRIPGPFVPNPMIAVFWDDLLTGSGDICYYHDQQNDRIIVQWSRMQSRFNFEEETFQAIIYSSEQSSSILGDNDIKLQYHTINNEDLGNYSGNYLDHGEYATIGIIDHTSTIGLEYTYANEYPVSAKQLESEMALFITGIPYSPGSPTPIISSTIIDDSTGNNTGLIDAGENIDLSFEFTNIGQQEILNPEVNVTSSSQYISFTNQSSDLPNLVMNTPNNVIEPISFSISENTPNNTSIELEIAFTADNYSKNIIYYLEVYNEAIDFVSFNYIDDNNQFEPGDIGIFELTFKNASYLPLGDTNVNLSCSDDFIVINDNSQNVSIVNQDEITLTFPVDANNCYASGIELIFDIEFEFSQGTITKSYSYFFGNQITLYSNTFDDSIEDFEMTNDVEWSNTNYAGGDPGEISLGHMYNYSDAVLTIPVSNVKKVIIDFDFYGTGNRYGFRSYYINDMNWRFLGNSSTPRHCHQEFVIPDNLPNNAGEINFYSQEASFFIDNLKITAISKGEGVVNGTVSAPSDYLEYLNHVTVSSQDLTTFVANDGTFSLSLPTGSNEIKIYGDGFIQQVQDVNIQLNNVTDIGNVDLELIPIPSNFSHNYSDDEVIELTWETDGLPTTPVFSHYKIRVEKNNHSLELTSYDEDKIIPLAYGNGEYKIQVKSILHNNNIGFYSEAYVINHTPNDNIEIPKSFALHSSYPNPYKITNENRNIGTIIKFDIPNDSQKCNLSIYDIKGRKIKTLINKPMKAGFHNVNWNGVNDSGSNVSSGIYFYRISTDQHSQIKKLTIIK